jgi:hypothetical protein
MPGNTTCRRYCDPRIQALVDVPTILTIAVIITGNVKEPVLFQKCAAPYLYV